MEDNGGKWEWYEYGWVMKNDYEWWGMRVNKDKWG